MTKQDLGSTSPVELPGDLLTFASDLLMHYRKIHVKTMGLISATEGFWWQVKKAKPSILAIQR